jgi:hypothetical protein
MTWTNFSFNVSFLKTGMWLAKGSFHGFCGQMSQWVRMGREEIGGDLGVSPDITDSPGFQTQWVSTKENHIAML